jgi:hypothetical protein
MKRLLALLVLLSAGLSLAVAQAPLNLYGRGAQGANGVVATAKPDSSQIS